MKRLGWIFALLPLSAAAFEPQGLYLMTRIFGSSLEMQTWYFRGNQFAQNPATSIQRFDFEAAERAAPGSAGTFTRAGDQWTFRWRNGKTQSARYEAAQPAGVCFYWNAGLFCPVKTFARGQLLDGSYSGSLGGGGVGSSRSYRFFKDGSYTLERAGSVDMRGAFAGRSSAERGRYRLEGNVLTLQADGGAVTALTTFPYEPGASADQPARFYAGGFMLKRTSAATASAVTTNAVPSSAATSNNCPDTLPAGTQSLLCQCTAESTQAGSVWGTDTYTADSRLCRAAVHAGVIGTNGGKIRVRSVPGLPNYAASTRNGIASSSWASWPSAFVVSKP